MQSFVRIFPFVSDEMMFINNISMSNEIYNKIDLGVSMESEAIKGVVISYSNAKGIKPDIIGSGTGLFVVSDKLKNLISDEFPTDMPFIEFLPVTSEGITDNYWILNVLQNIKCFDWEKSEYIPFPAKQNKIIDVPDTITKLVIDNVKVNNRNIFRMYEQPVFVFVSNRFHSFLVKNNATGYIVNSSSDLRELF